MTIDNGRVLRGNVEGKTVPETIVQEFVVGSIVTILVISRLAQACSKMMRRPAGQELSVWNGIADK